MKIFEGILKGSSLKKINNQELNNDIWRKIIEKKNSEHMLWILRKPYRFPIKIELKTKIGININQVLVETNLF